MAPIILALRVNAGVAIHFRCRGLENFGAQAFGQPQHVDGAMHAGLGGLDRVVLVMDGGGWAGQIIDLIGFNIERKCYVVADYLKLMMIEHTLDIAACAGEKNFDAGKIGAPLYPALPPMPAEK